MKDEVGFATSYRHLGLEIPTGVTTRLGREAGEYSMPVSRCQHVFQSESNSRVELPIASSLNGNVDGVPLRHSSN